MSLVALRQQLERETGKKMQVESDIEKNKAELKVAEKSLIRHEQAKEIVREVGLKTQQQLQYNISGIVTLAMSAVFDDPYELEVEFVLRRNKTECDLWFVRNEEKIKPIDASGGGALDVAAFALRIASWSMSETKTDNVMLLDEPFKHLKGEDANLRVLQMVKEISHKLGLQIIMVSDERIPKEDIIDNADKVFEVVMKKGVSKVKVL